MVSVVKETQLSKRGSTSSFQDWDSADRLSLPRFSDGGTTGSIGIKMSLPKKFNASLRH